jgi:Putative capsular polysaccharide synthesis protein
MRTSKLLGHLREEFGGFIPAGEEYDLHHKLDQAPPVLIYQMGKVGSLSLMKSLAASWPGLTIHTHAILRDKERDDKVNYVYRKVIRQGAPVFVISPVREPIGRNISAFFQNFERDVGLKYAESQFSIEDLIRIFLHHYDHDVPLRWFDKNFKPLFGMDVFQHDFPSHGVQALEHKNTKLLLMRCELPDGVKESFVKGFLNLPAFRLQSSNAGAEKDYGSMYKRFKEAFTPPDWYLSKMYESRYFNHFYQSQKNAWIERWTEKHVAL